MLLHRLAGVVKVLEALPQGAIAGRLMNGRRPGRAEGTPPRNPILCLGPRGEAVEGLSL
jgi:hypothetical protein